MLIVLKNLYKAKKILSIKELKLIEKSLKYYLMVKKERKF